MPARPFDRSIRYDRTPPDDPEREIERSGDPIGSTWETVVKRREPYLASAELEDAVNIAIGLGRPLLLQGEPGSGKTRLAHAVAYAFRLPLEEAYVKSTSRGRDLLYTYDTLQELRDVQLRRQQDRERYVTLGALGRAIARAAYGRRAVVLIDEIDKADLDFPNDLLREIEELKFDVSEVPGLTYAAPDDPELRPIVIITHNEEKALPDAFLRRCVYHYISFPQRAEQLEEILALHDLATAEVRSSGVRWVRALRELHLVKNPGLSELMDWVQYTHERGGDDEAALPHGGALLKLRGDQIRAAQVTGGPVVPRQPGPVDPPATRLDGHPEPDRG